MANPPPNPSPNSDGDGNTPYLVVDRFPSAKDLFDTSDPRVDQTTLFETYQEAMDWRGQLCRYELNNDATIPHKLEQKKAMVKTLFVAFKSIAVATDNENMIKPFREHRHDNGRVEVICWILLESAIRRSTNGPLLYAYDPVRAKYNSNLNDFAQRFDEIVTSLSTSKTICKHLYDAPYSSQFIDDPVLARKRVQANRELNKRKGKVMSEGRKLIEGQTKVPGDAKDGNGTTPEKSNINQLPPPSGPLESNMINDPSMHFPIIGNPFDDLTPHQNLDPFSGGYPGPNLFSNPQASTDHQYGPSFTPINSQVTSNAPQYHGGPQPLYGMDPFMGVPAHSTFSMPTELSNQFTTLGQPFDFGNEFGTGDTMFHFPQSSDKEISNMTPRVRPAKAKAKDKVTQSTSSSSAYTPQNMFASSESENSPHKADDSDNDPTYDPKNGRSKKQRR